MKQRAYIFINGILHKPGDIHGWPQRAADWIDTKTDFKACEYEYFCTAVLKQLWQQDRVKELVEKITPYCDSKFEIVLVGHSNGCDLICRLLREFPYPISEIHLFAAATNEDCRVNGINTAFAEKRLGEANYYCSKNDEVLECGASAFLRPIYRALGYGFLGYTGPKHECYRELSTIFWGGGYGHTDWFRPGLNFAKSMNMIMGRAPIG